MATGRDLKDVRARRAVRRGHLTRSWSSKNLLTPGAGADGRDSSTGTTTLATLWLEPRRRLPAVACFRLVGSIADRVNSLDPAGGLGDTSSRLVSCTKWYPRSERSSMCWKCLTTLTLSIIYLSDVEGASSGCANVAGTVPHASDCSI